MLITLGLRLTFRICKGLEFDRLTSGNDEKKYDDEFTEKILKNESSPKQKLIATYS